MGLSRIETIKSVVLSLLITLSVALTFLIWTYTPKYETIEQQTTVASISSKRDIADIVKPYKLLFHFEDGYQGTAESEEIDRVVNELKNWRITDLSLEEYDFNAEKLDEFMRKRNRFTLFFHGEVPFSVYDTVLGIEDLNIPEDTFDRIMIDWHSPDTTMNIHFISKMNNLRYSAKVNVYDRQQFNHSLLQKGKSYDAYTEVNDANMPFIAVPSEPLELVRHTFYQNEVSPTLFREALFNDPNAVRISQDGMNQEEYKDDHALMNVDKAKKTLTFVRPGARSKEIAIPSELFLNTFDFVNEHGGWTDDYRLMYMNPRSRYVKFQLFVQGLPVFSDNTSTKIEQVWGEEQVYQYMRPYYTLDLLHPESETTVLYPGTVVAEILNESDKVDFDTVEEIALGYSMEQGNVHNLFTLEPSWYFMINDSWIRFSPKQFGGEKRGLE